MRHQDDIHHRGFVDDKQVALERVAGTPTEASVLRVDLQQPVNGLRLEAGGLRHALGGATGGCGQQGAHTLGHEDRQDGAQHGGLAHTRAAGEHQDPRAERSCHCHPLTWRQRQRQLAFCPRNGAVGVDVGPRPRPGDEFGKPRRHRALRRIERRKCQDRRAVDDRPHDRRGRDFLGNGLIDQRWREFDEGRGTLAKLRDRERAMPLVDRLGQHVLQRPSTTTHRVGGNADLARDLIRGQEPDAANVASQPVGILGQHLDRVGAIGPMDADGAARAHTVRVQEDHDFPHRALALPVLDDAAGSHVTDAGDLEQAVGFAIDHVEDGGAEGRDEELGQVRPDTLDQSGAQVALDAFGRVRRRDADPVGLELLAVRAVLHPRAGRVDVLADGDLRRVADDGGGFASTPQRHAEDAEAALRIVIRDAFDLSGHVLGPLVAASQQRRPASLDLAAGHGGLRLEA